MWAELEDTNLTTISNLLMFFPLSENYIFGKFDAFCKRLEKIDDMLNTMENLSGLTTFKLEVRLPVSFITFIYHGICLSCYLPCYIVFYFLPSSNIMFYFSLSGCRDNCRSICNDCRECEKEVVRFTGSPQRRGTMTSRSYL